MVFKKGAIDWFDFPISSLENAREFYTELFGWEFESMDEMPYYRIMNDGVPIGGAYIMEEIKPGMGACFYVSVEDLQGSLDKALSLGAKLTREITEIGGDKGSFAIIQDPNGISLGLFRWGPS